MDDWRDSFPDLPIMQELGAQLEEAAIRDDEAHALPSPSDPERTRSRLSGRLAGWLGPVPWPALVTLAVVAIAVPVALVLDSGSGPTDRSPGVKHDTVLARGSGPQDPWALIIVPAADGTCLQLRIGGTVGPGARTCIPDPASGSAADPPAMAARAPVDFAVTTGRWDAFVFGTVPTATAKVRVSVGGQEVTTDAQTADGRLAPDGLRVFVAAFDEPLETGESIEVAAIDEQGDVIARLSRPTGG